MRPEAERTVTTLRADRRGTVLEITGAHNPTTVETPAIHPHLAHYLAQSLQTRPLEQAVASWRNSVEKNLPRPAQGGSGPTVVFDLAERVTGDEVVAWGRILAGMLRDDTRTVMICGPVDIQPDSDYDTLGALAASLIRLRVSLFMGVGPDAKALATQVGMEGSWDGESQWVPGVHEAYDYLCANVAEQDVVVVLGFTAEQRQLLSELWGVVTP